MGAEVSVGSFMINYLSLDAGEAMPETKRHIFYRSTGVAPCWVVLWVQSLCDTSKTSKRLAFNAVIAIMLLIITMYTTGSIAIGAILAVGLCNSIMFPSIFSLAIYELKELTSKGSGILCTAIVGGAIIPMLQGMLGRYHRHQVKLYCACRLLSLHCLLRDAD